MIDDPDFPRGRKEDYREFEALDTRANDSVKLDFILNCFDSVRSEFPHLTTSDVYVGFDYHGYNDPVVGFWFMRPETDAEYSKSLYYARRREERKQSKAKDQEEKERAELARLKAKYEGTKD